MTTPALWLDNLARLDPEHPPGDCSAARWRDVLEAAEDFVRNGWAAQAIERGWTEIDIFGADARAPHARVDVAGVVWLLPRVRVLRVGTAAVLVMTATGSLQSIYRRKHAVDTRVSLIWELAAKRQVAA